jgi:hypothetical protein
VRDADKPSNVNNQDNHSQFFSIHSISAVSQKETEAFFSQIIESDSDEL